MQARHSKGAALTVPNFALHGGNYFTFELSGCDELNRQVPENDCTTTTPADIGWITFELLNSERIIEIVAEKR